MLQWIIQFSLGLLISGNLWWMKRHIAQQDKKDDQQDKRINELEQNLLTYKLEVAEKYVSKDEFIRAISRSDRKLDQIYDEIIKLTASINGGQRHGSN